MNSIDLSELNRKMKTITNKVLAGESYTVYINSKPIFEIRPIASESSIKLESLAKKFEGFILRERSDLENISNEIDDILYS